MAMKWELGSSLMKMEIKCIINSQKKGLEHFVEMVQRVKRLEEGLALGMEE